MVLEASGFVFLFVYGAFGAWCRAPKKGRTCRAQVVIVSEEPRGSKYQTLRSLVPNTIEGVVFGTRNPECWILGPSGEGLLNRAGHVLFLFSAAAALSIRTSIIAST